MSEVRSGASWVIIAGAACALLSWSSSARARPVDTEHFCASPDADQLSRAGRAELCPDGVRVPRVRSVRAPRVRRVRPRTPPRAVGWLGVSGIASLHANWLARINEALRTNGYTEVGHLQPIFGFAFDGGYGRVRAAWDLGCPGKRHYERLSDGARFGVSQCYIGFDFGYDVVQWRGLSIFPMLGIGGGDLRIVVDPNAAPFLRGQLGPDDAGTEIRRNVGLFRGLIGIEERVRIWDAQQLSLLFGARAGYIQQFVQAAWAHADPKGADLYGGPTVDTSGPFLRIGLGFAVDSR
jgi:hypothetical protein